MEELPEDLRLLIMNAERRLRIRDAQEEESMQRRQVSSPIRAKRMFSYTQLDDTPFHVKKSTVFFNTDQKKPQFDSNRSIWRGLIQKYGSVTPEMIDEYQKHKNIEYENWYSNQYKKLIDYKSTLSRPPRPSLHLGSASMPPVQSSSHPRHASTHHCSS